MPRLSALCALCAKCRLSGGIPLVALASRLSALASRLSALCAFYAKCRLDNGIPLVAPMPRLSALCAKLMLSGGIPLVGVAAPRLSALCALCAKCRLENGILFVGVGASPFGIVRQVDAVRWHFACGAGVLQALVGFAGL